MPEWIWSWLFLAMGLMVNYLTGKKKKIGWALGVFSQIFWYWFAIHLHQWGFIVAATLYGSIYARNWWLWRKEERV